MSLDVEYRAAREGAAVFAWDERQILAVTGPQRQKFLNAMLSNDVASLQPGRGCCAALMDVKGHLSALMRVLATPDALLLEMPAARLAPVEATLRHYKVAAPVRFEARPAAIFGLLGPGARDVLARSGFELPSDLAPEQHVTGSVAGHEARATRASDLPAGGLALHAAPEARDGVWGALLDAGALRVSREVLDALRVEDGCAFYGPDVSEENLLHETGLVRVFHSPTKGCYLGQEVIARLEARGGNVNKALRGLLLSAPAEAGAVVRASGDEVGRVTTAGVSPRFGPIAMAYVHRNHFAPGTQVEVAGAPATVVALPMEA